MKLTCKYHKDSQSLTLYFPDKFDTTKLANASVTTDILANDSVTTLKIVDAAIEAVKLATASITSEKVATAAIGSSHLQDALVTTAKIANLAVDTSRLADLTITAGKLASSCVEASKIANLAVGAAAIASLAVGTAKIADAAILEAKIDNAAVTSAKIFDAAIVSAKIADLAVIEAKIGLLAVNTAQMANLSVTNAKIANVDATKITTGYLAANRIEAGSIVLSKITGLGGLAIEDNLDGVPNGTTYSKVLTTAISAGKIVLTSAGVTGTLPVSLSEADVSPALPSDEHLVGYWAFDDGSGSVAVDGSGNSHNGTLVNTPTWVDGKVGKCLDFEADNNEYVSIPDSVLTLNNNFTLSFWVCPEDDAMNSRWITLIDAVDNFQVCQMSTENVCIRMDATAIQTAASAITYGTWYHIVVVRSGGVFILYMDAVETSTSAGGISDDGQFSAIGGGYSNYNSDGKIDEVRIYNTALTASEIKALYLYPAGNKSPIPASLDNLADGATYGRVLTTAISAGKIVLTSAGVSGSLPTSLSAAKCTDALADQTSTHIAYDTSRVNNLASTTIILAGKIGTGLVVADSINVTNLSAISANLGSVTAGTITMPSTGWIKGGQTAYATGTGFFLGYSGAAYKFSFGSSTKYIKWDGSNLLVGGDVIATGNIQANAVSTKGNGTNIATTMSVLGTWTDLVTVNITLIDGGNILLIGKIGEIVAGGPAMCRIDVRITRDGTEIARSQAKTTIWEGINKQSLSTSIMDTTTSGAKTYKLQYKRTAGDNNPVANDNTLSAIEFAR